MNLKSIYSSTSIATFVPSELQRQKPPDNRVTGHLLWASSWKGKGDGDLAPTLKMFQWPPAQTVSKERQFSVLINWLKTTETILVCLKLDRSLLHLVSEFQLTALCAEFYVAGAGLSFGNWLVI